MGFKGCLGFEALSACSVCREFSAWEGAKVGLRSLGPRASNSREDDRKGCKLLRFEGVSLNRVRAQDS